MIQSTLSALFATSSVVYDDDGGVNKYVTDLNKKVLLILYRCFISGKPLGEYLEFLLFFAS